jgi:hypothetical protein
VNVFPNGSFTMTGGEISGNSVSGKFGGGVFVRDNGSFTMGGGVISGNKADGGGGVAVVRGGSFTMGREVIPGSFTMEGGEISGNSASSFGGGVFVVNDSSFSKTGGIIYGDTDGTVGNGNNTDNTAKNGNTTGHAVYYRANSSNNYYRDAALGEEDDISTNNTGSGWGR